MQSNAIRREVVCVFVDVDHGGEVKGSHGKHGKHGKHGRHGRDELSRKARKDGLSRKARKTRKETGKEIKGRTKNEMRKWKQEVKARNRPARLLLLETAC
jgi:hypothetical protein